MKSYVNALSLDKDRATYSIWSNSCFDFKDDVIDEGLSDSSNKGSSADE
jgi:hypothetical protein